jgi:hypothetical protein
MPFDQKQWYRQWYAEYRKRPEVRARRNHQAKLAARVKRASEDKDARNAKQREYMKHWAARRDAEWLQEAMSNPFCVASYFFHVACRHFRKVANSNRKMCDRYFHFLNEEEKKYQLRTWRLNEKYAIMCDPVRSADYKQRTRSSAKKYAGSEKRKEWYSVYSQQPQVKLRLALRTRLRGAIDRAKMTRNTEYLVGCNYEELVRHIESQWQPGMSWDNYGSGDGEWSVDHRKPLAAFDLGDPEQQKSACHFTNLQPMWAVDNFKKNSFWNGRKWTYADHLKEAA